MELIYKGKTKDVYKNSKGQVVLKFKDDVTGVDGKFDPGANQVGLSIEGVGAKNLKMTTYFFEKVKEAGISSHYITSDLKENTLTVKPATAFGKGVEVITRYRAVGSFIRRYGAYIESGTPLAGYVEFTLKDDKRQDPLVTKEGLIALGILTEEEYDTVVKLNLQVANLIKKELAAKGLELYDLKLEFGKVEGSDEIVLIDEISGGNMRVYKDQDYIDPMVLADYFG